VSCARALNAPWESGIIVYIPAAQQTGMKFASTLSCKVSRMLHEFSCGMRSGN
jgi:hypothetical protein